MCTTPATAWVSSRIASWSRSETSQATTVASSSSAASSGAPGALGPERLTRSRSRAPFSCSQRATCAPSAPVPPVTRIGALRHPVARDPRRADAVGQAAGEHARRADGEFVLGAVQGRDQVVAAVAVGEVDDPAPAVGVLGGGDPAEAPQEAPGRGWSGRRARPRRR